MYIEDFTILFGALPRRPAGLALCSAAARICDGSRCISCMHSSYSLDAHTAAVFLKVNDGRSDKHYGTHGYRL